MAEVGWKTVTVPPISQRQDGSAFHVRQRLPATTVKTEDGCSVTNNQCRSYGSALEPDSIVRLSNFDRDGVDNSVRTKSPDKTKSNKLSGNLEPPLVHSVGATVSSYKNDISGHLSTYDAKRLELAMAANRYHSVKTHGGHIMSQSALSPETHQQIHPKNCGTPRLSPVSNENNVQVPENYMGSRYLPPSVDSHSVGIRTSAALHNGCYTVSDGMNGMTSSPDSESMSPPLSNSPAVVPELSSRRFPSSDIEDQTPVAVISKRASLINLSAEDSRRSNGEMKNVRSENRIYQMSDHASTDRCRQQQLQSPPRPAIASVAPHSKRQKLVMSTSPQNNAYKSIISRQKKGSIDVLHVSNQMKSSVVDAININSALASSNNVSVLSVPSKLASPPIIQASEEGFASGVG
ncbi:hypothetical protein AB6A40_008289 [Gnathostoma spinigerum]|uniref:Uncharacterized protein n=1 Tax=Gnathostoma spinigerum TaxID=75299 RepID=A0ABD6EPX5_9BILA